MTDADDKPYEDRLSDAELRRELRRAWDEASALKTAMLELPEVPPVLAMWALTRVGMNSQLLGFDAWEIGKRMQREHPGAIPYKTELEAACGIWSIIRRALLDARTEPPQPTPTPKGERE